MGGWFGRVLPVGVLRFVSPRVRGLVVQGAVAGFLVCLGVVLNKNLAWVGIAVMLTVLGFFALASWVESTRRDSSAKTAALDPTEERSPERPAAVARQEVPKLSPLPPRSPATPLPRDPRDALAQRLARLHGESIRLKRSLIVASAAVAGEFVTGDPPKTRIMCDEQTRAWDWQVTDALLTNGDSALSAKWQSAATLPPAHPTLRRIEPATTLPQLREFVDAKQACLRKMIAELGEPVSEPSVAPKPVAPDRTPEERLRKALSSALKLRSRVAGSPHKPAEIGKDPIYLWTRDEVWPLLRDELPEYADEFTGEKYRHLTDTFMLAWDWQVTEEGRMQYLDRRIELLKRILRERRGP